MAAPRPRRPRRPVSERLFQFKGPDSEYAIYLEKLIIQLQVQISKSQGQTLSIGPTINKAQGQTLSTGPTINKSQGQTLSTGPTINKSQGQTLSTGPTINKSRGQTLSTGPTIDKPRGQTLTEPTIDRGLEIVFRLEAPENQKEPEPSWVTATKSFLAGLPNSPEEWRYRQKETLLLTPQQNIVAFETLTLRPPPTYSDFPCINATASPQQLLRAYRDLRLYLQKQAKHSIQVDAYSDLVWFCFCEVARGNGMSVEEVDDLVPDIVEKDFTSRYMSRLRRAAKWVACRIEELENELGYLGSYIFLLFCPTMRTFQTWTDWVETANHIVQEITKKYKESQELFSQDITMSFSPVFLVTYLGPWSLDQVNTALMTNVSQSIHDERLTHMRETRELAQRTNDTETEQSAESPANANQSESQPSPTYPTGRKVPGSSRSTKRRKTQHKHDDRNTIPREGEAGPSTSGSSPVSSTPSGVPANIPGSSQTPPSRLEPNSPHITGKDVSPPDAGEYGNDATMSDAPAEANGPDENARAVPSTEPHVTETQNSPTTALNSPLYNDRLDSEPAERTKTSENDIRAEKDVMVSQGAISHDSEHGISLEMPRSEMNTASTPLFPVASLQLLCSDDDLTNPNDIWATQEPDSCCTDCGTTDGLCMHALVNAANHESATGGIALPLDPSMGMHAGEVAHGETIGTQLDHDGSRGLTLADIFDFGYGTQLDYDGANDARQDLEYLLSRFSAQPDNI